MKHLLIPFFLCLLGSNSLFAQDDIWKTLSDLSWNNYYDETLGFDVSQPLFGEPIKALDRKEITVKGYIVPVDVEGDYQILSAFPYSSCFFCGGAGPETVMEVDMPKNRRLVNKQVTLRGRLTLNDKDFYQLIYRLEDAEVIAEEMF